MKIAMWSGPRNLSTAMMYSFGNRADITVWDEPFYAAYLAQTGIDHPMREAVIAQGETEPHKVAAQISASTGVQFYKLMTFHMLKDFPMDWAAGCTHIHLLRHPARVIASYSAKRDNPSRADIGFDAQLELYRRFPGPVISAADIRQNPGDMLQRLCAAISLPFDPAMLRWPAGPKPFDGIWASHWYDAVHRSTGFAGAEGPLPDLSGTQANLLAQVLPAYEEMLEAKL